MSGGGLKLGVGRHSRNRPGTAMLVWPVVKLVATSMNASAKASAPRGSTHRRCFMGTPRLDRGRTFVAGPPTRHDLGTNSFLPVEGLTRNAPHDQTIVIFPRALPPVKH